MASQRTQGDADAEMIAMFEERFARYVGVKYAVAVSSGTTGLMAAMLALRMEPSDNVVTTPLTHISTSNSVLFAGGIPFFADVEESTLCLNPEKAVQTMNDRTKAVIGVHLYGLPFDAEAFHNVRRTRGVKVVEDAAQALGAIKGGKKVGSLGDLAVFSFYGTKHIRLGEGGMITTDEFELAQRCRQIGSHGESKMYYHTTLGYNFRLPRSTVEWGLKQLANVDNELRRRRELAKLYSDHLKNLSGLTLQQAGPGDEHSYYKFPVVVEEMRADKVDTLAQRVSASVSAAVGRGYGLLSYQQPLYRNINSLFWGAKLMSFPDYSRYSLPNAEYAVERIVEFPTDHTVDEKKAVKISESFLQELRRARTN